MKVLKSAWPIIFLSLTVLIFFAKLFYPKPKIFITPDFGLSDTLHFHLSVKSHLADSLKQNKIPFLTTNLANGFPLFNQGEIGVFNLLNFFFFKFFDPVFAFNFNIILNFFLAAFFSYQYLKLIKLKTLPALFSSLSFTFSFYLITQISHYEILQGICLFPLLLFLLQKFIASNKIKYLIFFSFVLSQQIFAGFPQTVFISLLFLSSYFLYFNLSSFWKPVYFFQKKILIYFLFVFLGIGLSTIQLLPSKNFLNISNRKAGFAGQTATMFSYPPKHLLTLFKPFALGNPAKGTYPHFQDFNGSIFWENTGYFGIIALVFSLLSLIFIKKNKYIKFFWLTAITSFLLMTGKHSPFYFIFSFFPFNLFRIPSRFIFIFVFSLTALAGLFLNEIMNLFKLLSKYKLYILFALCLAINLADLFKTGYSYHPIMAKEKALKTPETVEFLSKFKDNRIFVFERGGAWNNIYFKEGWQNPEKFIFLNNNLTANINLLWNIPSFNTYEILVSERYQLLNRLINDQFRKLENEKVWQISDFGIKLLRQNGINFIIIPEKINLPTKEKNLELVFQTSKQNEAQFYIYQIKNSLPSIRLINRVEKAEVLRDFINKLNSADFDLETTIISSEKLSNLSPINKKNQIKILKKESEVLEFEAQLAQKAYLAIQQAYLPGWTAYLNNKKIEIYPINLNQMAVLLPEGKHHLKLIYHPKGFYTGAIISLISLLILAFFLLLFPNKRLKTP